MPLDALARFQRTHAALIEGLYSKLSALHPPLPSGLAIPAFASALHRSSSHYFGTSSPSSSQLASYLESLHLADLALAAACAEGVPAPWDHFVKEFRPILYAAGRAIAGESGRELADSIYAELFGLEERDGQRRSLFLYFHGRSKLSTWLRSVLAQRHVDSLRAARRTASLDEMNEDSGDPACQTHSGVAGRSSNSGIGGLHRKGALGPDAQDPDRPRLLALLQSALTAALAALAPQDRLRLSYYYVQDLTLAQIGRLLHEHEATVSRKLDRTRRELRQKVERTLREEKRLSQAQIHLCFDYAQEEWPYDLTRSLM